MDLGLKENQKDQYALFTLVGFGFGEVFGAFFMGWFIDKFDPRKGTLMNILIIILTISVTLASIGASRFNWLSYLMSFMWGIADGTINIHTLQTLGFEFNSHSEPFGVFNLVQGISVFTF